MLQIHEPNKTRYPVRQIAAWWPLIVGLLVGLWFIIIPVTGTGFTHFPGDLGDARFNNYILEHVHLWFTGQQPELWNAPFMYPEEQVITYSDNLLGTAPFYSAFRLTGIDRETAFQWWYVLMAALNFVCCYLFLWWCFRNHYAAALGAFVFAFSLALQSQLTHAQTFPRFAVPLAIWMGALFYEHFNPKYFLGAVLLIVYQFYCSLYLGFMLAVPVGLVLAFALWNHRDVLPQRIRKGRWLAAMSASAGTAILLLLPLMLPYMARSSSLGAYDYGNILHTVPTLKSYFFSQPGSLWWDGLKETATTYTAWWDHQIFPGGIAMVALVLWTALVLIKRIRPGMLPGISLAPAVTMLWLAGLVTALLFVRFNEFSLYQALYQLPGFGALRSLTRIINIQLVFFAIGTAAATSLVLYRTKKWGPLVFAALLALLTADNYLHPGAAYRTEKAVSQERIGYVLHALEGAPPEAIVAYEPDEPGPNPVWHHLDAMLAAQQAGLRTVNGYSSTAPYGYDRYWTCPLPVEREFWFDLKGVKPDTVWVVR